MDQGKCEECSMPLDESTKCSNNCGCCCHCCKCEDCNCADKAKTDKEKEN